MRSRQIQIADAAVALGRWIAVACALTLAFIALGSLALMGDEIQQSRIEATK